MSMDIRARPGRFRTATIGAVAAVAVVVAVAFWQPWRGEDAPTAAPSPATSPSPEPTDPQGAKACKLNLAALQQKELMSALTMIEVINAGRNAKDEGIRQQTETLLDAHVTAVEGNGKPGSAGHRIQLEIESTRFQQACLSAKLGG